MIREINILETGIYPKLEHLFSSKKHKIFRAYERQTAQTYLTKIIVAKDQGVFNLYKQHILNNILPYLVSIKYLKHSSFLSLRHEVGQAMVKKQFLQENESSYNYEGNEEVDNNQTYVRKEKDSVTIILSKKMIKGVTLRQMILNKDDRLNEDFCLDLIGQLVDFLFMGNGVKDMFITTQNIIVEDTGFVYFNYFSFTGLQFIKQDKYITRVQFEQLLPYLTPAIMKNKNEIDLEVELRFILVNFISAYFKKDIIFSGGHYNLDVQVKRDKILLGVVSKVTCNLLPNILSKEEKRKLQNHKTNIANLWNQFFNKMSQKQQKQGQGKQSQNKQTQSKQTFSCTWQYILQNLSAYKQLQSKSQYQLINQDNNGQIDSQKKQDIDKRSKIKIKQFIRQLDVNKKKNSIFIASTFHDAVDIFINIVDEILSQMKNQDLKLKNIAKIQKFKDSLVEERKKLLARGRYSKSVYIPIKTGMKFSSILKYKNWIMMLQQSGSANQATISAIFNLFKFILDIRQTMSDIGPFISIKILQNNIQNKTNKNNSETSNQKSQQSSFYKLLASLSASEQLRRWFWQMFFVITNKILLLAKNFYLRATAFQLFEKIMINQHNFSSILQNFKEFIPPLPQFKEIKTSERNPSINNQGQQNSEVGVS